MLKKLLKKLHENNFKRLECQFEIEDLEKEVLLYGKDLSEEEIEFRQEMLNCRMAKRKNLYIYPEKVNV